MAIKPVVNQRRAASTIFIVLFLTVTPFAETLASIVPISSSLSINGASNLDSFVPNPGTAVIDSQGASNNPLSISYNRVLDNGIESITEAGLAQADWSNASSGSVLFDLTLSSGVFIDGYFGFDDFNYGFEYDFTATTNGVLTFGGSVSGELGGVIISSSILGGAVLDTGNLSALTPGPASLFLTTNLMAGEDYRLTFYPITGLACATVPGAPPFPCDLSNLDYTNHADLSFEFQPVPIPAAVWLFGSGLIGLIGIARRKNS